MRKFGLIGAGLAAVCCVTPVLPVALGAVGLGGLVGYVYNDFVLFGALLLFVALAVIGHLRMKSS